MSFAAWRGNISSLKLLEETKESSSLSNTAELDAKGLHFYKQLLNVDDLVADQRLEKDTQQPYQPKNVRNSGISELNARKTGLGKRTLSELFSIFKKFNTCFVCTCL